MRLPRPLQSARSCTCFLFTVGRTYGWGEFSGHGWRALAAGALPALFLLRSTQDEVYNILWALVFGFATLNIVSLGARRFDPAKTGLNFGEIVAILVVVVAIVLLGWEMLYVFGILPIRLAPR